MAAKTHTITSASWNPSVVNGKDTITITGVTALTPSEGGSLQAFFCDGDVYSQIAWMENLTQGMQVTTSDLSILGTASHLMQVGDEGVLTVQMPQRAAGHAGLATGANLMVQYICGAGGTPQDDGCTLTGVAPSASQTGPASVNLNFSLTSDDGVTDPVAISMATYS